MLPDPEVALDLPEGWDASRDPWSFATSRAGWDALLARSRGVDWDVETPLAAAVAHVELDVSFPDGGANGRVKLELVGAVPAEEVSVGGFPEPLPGRPPPADAAERAVELSLLRLDPMRYTGTFESVDERPVVARDAKSARVVVRCAATPPPVAGARRGWIVVPVDEAGSGEQRFRLLPTDLSADDRCVAEPVARRAGATASLPRCRLAEATESLFWPMRDQALRQLEDAARSYPGSADPIVRLVVELAREGKRGEAIERGRKFLAATGGEHPVLAKLVSWLASFPADASICCSPRRWRTETFGDPRLPEEYFARAAGAAQESLLALEHLHLDDAETFVVLIDADDGDAKWTVEVASEGWISLRRVEVYVPGFLDAPTALGQLAFDLIDGGRSESMSRAFGAFALSSWINARLGLGIVEKNGERGFAGLEWEAENFFHPDKQDNLHCRIASWLESPAAFERLSTATNLSWLPATTLAPLIARRIFEHDGPAALAEFVRTGVVRPDQMPRDAADLIDHPPAGSIRLQHLGHACFRLTADDGTRLLIDPFSSRYWLGTRFPWIVADGVAMTHDHPDHAAFDEIAGAPRRLALDLSNDAPAVQTADLGPFHVQAFKTLHDRRYCGGEPMTNLVVAVDVARLRIVHLGDVQAPLDEELCAKLDPVDVLLAPIDDLGHILDAAQLAEIVQRLAPRVLVPMHYRVALPGGSDVDDLGGIEQWLRGVERVRRLDGDAAVMVRAGLPSETEIWVLRLAPWPEGRLEAVR